MLCRISVFVGAFLAAFAIVDCPPCEVKGWKVCPSDKVDVMIKVCSPKKATRERPKMAEFSTIFPRWVAFPRFLANFTADNPNSPSKWPFQNNSHYPIRWVPRPALKILVAPLAIT